MAESISIPLPRTWHHYAKAAVVHTVALASAVSAIVRGQRINSPLKIARLQARVWQLEQEGAAKDTRIALLHARLSRVPPAKRPHYLPHERLKILLLRAMQHWSNTQTARMLLLDRQTVADWLKNPDKRRLLALPYPVNRFPDFVRYIVQQLKLLCPHLGRRGLVQLLARAGLHMAASSAGRMVKEKPLREPEPLRKPVKATELEDIPVQTPKLKARYAHHYWHVDFTAFPLDAGFWIPWSPHALPQQLPFGWWIGVVEDSFTRKVLATCVLQQRPCTEDALGLISKAVQQSGHAPKDIICDKDSAFDNDSFRKGCKRMGIPRVRYGKAGKHGSIAVVERAIRTMKDECLRKISVAMPKEEVQEELDIWRDWYNTQRPHSYLLGATPHETEQGVTPAHQLPRFEPREHWPHTLGIRGRPGQRLKLKVAHYRGRKHLPVVRVLAA